MCIRDRSSATPNLPIGICFKMFAFKSSLNSKVISVSMKPGAMQFAVTPRPASSRATDCVNPINPALLLSLIHI